MNRLTVSAALVGPARPKKTLCGKCQSSCKEFSKSILRTLTYILAASSSKVQFVQVKPQPVSNYRALLVAEVVYRLDKGHSVCPPRCDSFKHRVDPLTRAGNRIPINARTRCLRCMPKGTRQQPILFDFTVRFYLIADKQYFTSAYRQHLDCLFKANLKLGQGSLLARWKIQASEIRDRRVIIVAGPCLGQDDIAIARS